MPRVVIPVRRVEHRDADNRRVRLGRTSFSPPPPLAFGHVGRRLAWLPSRGEDEG